VTALFGRARELTLLDARLAAAASGQRGLALLEGEPGIGETRLADEACERARARDFLVARGAALSDAGAPALACWRAVARSLSQALRKVLDADASSSSGAVDEARWRLFEAFADALSSHARDKPLLIMLDDLHDADVASVELLLFWVRNVQHGCWLVIGTLRDAASRVSSANDALLARIQRKAETIQVGPLSLDDVSAWMRMSPWTNSNSVTWPARISASRPTHNSLRPSGRRTIIGLRRCCARCVRPCTGASTTPNVGPNRAG